MIRSSRMMLSAVLMLCLLATGQAALAAETSEASSSVESKAARSVPVKKVSLDITNMLLKPDGTGQLKATVSPSKASRKVKYSSSKEYVATVDANGLVTAHGSGSATIKALGANGKYATCKVTVEGRRYRALLIGQFARSSDSHYLPFVAPDLAGMKQALKKSWGTDSPYKITTAPFNLKKKSMRSIIRSTFSDNTPNDVSFLMLTTHGHARKGNLYITLTGFYQHTTNKDYYLTPSEFVSWIQEIQGNVVVFLSACNSGQVIDIMNSKGVASSVAVDPINPAELVQSMEKALSPQDASRINILCSSQYGEASTYYKGSKSFDFMTAAGCYALGVDIKERKVLNNEQADIDGDNRVTVGEFARTTTVTMRQLIEKYRSSRSFRGSVNANVQSSIGNPDLVMMRLK